MRALTVKQPWSALIVSGFKDIENRSWGTRHRGTMAIHAGLSYATPDEWDHARGIAEHVGAPWDALADLRAQTGVILGTVDLVDVELACDCSPWAFPDAYHWKLENAVRFDTPVPYKGAQGLWEWRQ